MEILGCWVLLSQQSLGSRSLQVPQYMFLRSGLGSGLTNGNYLCSSHSPPMSHDLHPNPLISILSSSRHGQLVNPIHPLSFWEDLKSLPLAVLGHKKEIPSMQSKSGRPGHPCCQGEVGCLAPSDGGGRSKRHKETWSPQSLLNFASSSWK